MKRTLFTLASAVSLLLCLGTGVLWVRSYTTFDDLDRIHTSRTPTSYTQHYIRLGSNSGRFLFTWRDIVWPSNSRSFSYVTSTWEKANGVHFTHQQTFDLERTFVKRPTDRSWETRAAGIRFKRVLVDPGPATASLAPVSYPGMTGVVLIIPHLYVTAFLAVVAAVGLAKSRRSARRGCCLACGYSLTGNISGVCPECGMPVPKEQESPG